jgi:hypothetical protein
VRPLSRDAKPCRLSGTYSHRDCFGAIGCVLIDPKPTFKVLAARAFLPFRQPLAIYLRDCWRGEWFRGLRNLVSFAMTRSNSRHASPLLMLFCQGKAVSSDNTIATQALGLVKCDIRPSHERV